MDCAGEIERLRSEMEGLRAEVSRLRGELSDARSALSRHDHDIDMLFEKIGDSADDDDTRRRCVLDLYYDDMSGYVKVLYGTLAGDVFEPDDSWSTATGAGPYGGGGTKAEEEDW